MRSWIKLHQKNINEKSLGFPISLFPKSYQTNCVINESLVFKGNYGDISIESKENFLNSISKLLSLVVFNSASENNIKIFKITVESALDLIYSISPESFKNPKDGFKSLQMSIQGGCKHLNIDDSFFKDILDRMNNKFND